MKDKKAGKKQVSGKPGVDDENERPRALQVELSVRLCQLTCDADTQRPAAGDIDDN